MLKKLIKYTDYNGTERQENFYFNLNKAELMEMETEVTGGMRQLLGLIMEKQDVPKIMSAFKTIILKAYGEKSPDGRVFNKSEELSNAFAHTEAYSELYMELLSDAKKASEFITALMPVEMRGTPEEDAKVLTPVGKKEDNKEETEQKDGNAHLLNVVK